MSDMRNKALQGLENIFSKEKLLKTISLSSLFVLTFECFKDMVIDRPHSFFCLSNMEFEDGKVVYHDTEEYKQRVRRLDKKPLHASLRWFVDHEVITDSDYQRVLEIELRRNDFVHELLNVVNSGISEADKQLFTDLISIYKKIDSWWIFNVEIDGDEIENPDSIKQEECCSCTIILIEAMQNILLDGHSDIYEEFLSQIKKDITCNNLATNVQSVASHDGAKS